MTIIKKLKYWGITKMCYRNMKRANAGGKIVPTDLLDSVYKNNIWEAQ